MFHTEASASAGCCKHRAKYDFPGGPHLKTSIIGPLSLKLRYCLVTTRGGCVTLLLPQRRCNAAR